MTSSSPVRVLVVDDNEELRENLAEALVLEGYAVGEAADGARALQRLDAEPFDAVLLDLTMPGMDGRELLACIRRDARLARLRVVVTTGHPASAARADMPADGFLLKPFGVRELLAALREIGLGSEPGDNAA